LVRAGVDDLDGLEWLVGSLVHVGRRRQRQQQQQQQEQEQEHS
jgi:hypothetical protein